MSAYLIGSLRQSSDYNCWSIFRFIFSYMLAEYMSRVQEVALRVLELMAEGMGMEDTNVFSRMVQRDGSDVLLRVNHYPLAMRHQAAAGGAVGFGEHTDPQIISVLRSNGTSGLEIALRGGAWASVPPDGDAFFVNVGDTLQVRPLIACLLLCQSVCQCSRSSKQSSQSRAASERYSLEIFRWVNIHPTRIHDRPTCK